ncbi:MAG: hypothetical protein E7Z93_01130 [Cyanobacteria bacterium SIG32]|nr:hypothetical protein [Cyanobacteria bacterium SIG32]
MEPTNNLDKFSSSADQQLFGNNDNSRNGSKIDDLVSYDVLNSQQGRYCMSELAKDTIEKIIQEQILPTFRVNSPSAIEEFSKEKPDFFNSEGRKDVLNYLQNSNFIVDKDEMNRISQMVEKLEQCAIDRYLQQQAYEKNLSNENELAKRKLTANAQNNSSFGVNKSGIFTREQIGRMSGAEFTKNEPLIMEQLRKGLIK